MASNKELDLGGDFLVSFVQALMKNMIDSGMIKVDKYPDIEKIKQNIKIYEKPENTIANAILMNQNPEIQKMMMQPYESVKEVYTNKANIASIMQNGNITGAQNPNLLRMSNLKQQIRSVRNNSFTSPVSQPMPFMHKETNMRMLPASGRTNVVQIKEIPVQAAPAAPEKVTLLGLSQLDGILSDPYVQTIECPGPNKPLLIYKGGAVQASKFNLTSDEIKGIIKDISEKTRIPLASGVFKAAYGNLIITAVMSDFVGTRFMVQKKPQSPAPGPTSIYQQ